MPPGLGRGASAVVIAMELTPDLRRPEQTAAVALREAEWAAWRAAGGLEPSSAESPGQGRLEAIRPLNDDAYVAAGPDLFAEPDERLAEPRAAAGAPERDLRRFLAASVAAHLCLLAAFVFLTPQGPAAERSQETPVEVVVEQPQKPAEQDAKPPPPKTAEAKPPETKPPEAKAAEQKPPEPKPPEVKPPEAKPPEAKAAEAKPSAEKPPEQKPPEQKPPEQKPPETKPPEPAQANAAGQKPAAQKPDEPKRAELKPPPAEPAPSRAAARTAAAAAQKEARAAAAEAQKEARAAAAAQKEARTAAAAAQKEARANAAKPPQDPASKLAANLPSNSAGGLDARSEPNSLRLPFDNGPDIFRAVAVPLPTAGGDEPMSYKMIVFGLLERAKEYPEAAKQRGARGSAVVSFAIDDAGQLTNVSLLRSSGDSDLDIESVALVARAAPFPKPPADAQREFAAEITFGLEQADGDGAAPATAANH